MTPKQREYMLLDDTELDRRFEIAVEKLLIGQGFSPPTQTRVVAHGAGANIPPVVTGQGCYMQYWPRTNR